MNILQIDTRGCQLESELQIEEFVFSAVVGFAIKKVMKIAAVVVGLFAAALAYLSYKGLIDVKWVAMESITRSALTNASGQVVHALNNTATQFAAHPPLPIAAMFGFVPGLIMGLKKG